MGAPGARTAGASCPRASGAPSGSAVAAQGPPGSGSGPRPEEATRKTRKRRKERKCPEKNPRIIAYFCHMRLKTICTHVTTVCFFRASHITFSSSQNFVYIVHNSLPSLSLQIIITSNPLLLLFQFFFGGGGLELGEFVALLVYDVKILPPICFCSSHCSLTKWSKL